MNAKTKRFYFDYAIMFIIMIGAHFVPTVSTITPFGMQVLGIFVALLYGWTTQGTLLPSLIGMVALFATKSISVTDFWAQGFGSTTVVFMVLIFIYMALVDSSGVMAFMANWFVTRKFVSGRPWILSATLLLGCFYTAALANPVASLMIFWGIIYRICSLMGYKPFEKWPTIMIVGVMIASTLGWGAFPYKILALMILGSYSSLTGSAINFGAYSLSAIVLGSLCVIGYVIVARFIYRPNVDALKNFSSDFIDKSALVLNRRQKIVFASLLIFVALVVFPSLLTNILPRFSAFMQMIDTSGLLVAVIAVLLLIRVDGEPLMDFCESARRGVLWDSVIITSIILPIASLLMADPTGIKNAMVAILKPILVGRGPIVFMILVIVIAAVLTNFANNAVVGILFVSISFAMAESIGLNFPAITTLIVIVSHLALFTPAASPLAAMLFSNKEWMTSKDIMKYSAGGILAGIVVLIVVGIPLTGFLF